MTTAEAKAAYLEGSGPVICCGIEYDEIIGIASRKVNGKRINQVELLSKTGNSVTIARPEQVEVK